MPKYMTKQRRLLLEFLQTHPDQLLSAGEIAAAIPEEPVSVSAVYRNLADLERDGKVRRLSRQGSRETFFQYTDAAECRNCLHLSCTRCGKTFHMAPGGTERLAREVEAQEMFQLDRSETVLFGLCRDCRR